MGFERSPWVGLEIFEDIFRNRDFFRALRNSIVFNILSLGRLVPRAHHPGADAERAALPTL